MCTICGQEHAYSPVYVPLLAAIFGTSPGRGHAPGSTFTTALNVSSPQQRTRRRRRSAGGLALVEASDLLSAEPSSIYTHARQDERTAVPLDIMEHQADFLS